MLRILNFCVGGTLLLAACSGGSAIVTGTPRKALESSEVKLYLTPPPHYTVIGIVDAHSNRGIYEGSEAKMKNAIEALKEQAASVGANGVLLNSQDQSSWISHVVTLTGTAIYVPPNRPPDR